MAVVNQLPSLMGKEPKIVFIGGGWKQASGGNEYGIYQKEYLDHEFFSESGSGIICQKDFRGYVVIAQGVARDGSASDYRSLYNASGDILKTPTGATEEAHRLYNFTAGEYIRGWNQVGTDNLLSVGYTVILAF